MFLNIEGPLLSNAAQCKPIIDSLPDYFGTPEITNYLLEDIESLPMFIASEDNEQVGFLSIKSINRFTAEIFLMAVRSDRLRNSVGKVLITTAEEFLKKQGIEYLEVKTLGPKNPDANFKRARAFYLKMGFRPLDELPKFWDDDNSILAMVKKL